jgi:uncharacterized protein (TIGR02757 family)
MKKQLETIYSKYNHREFVHPDPLEFLYDYLDIKDREIIGLIASSLAYGRVAQILKSVSLVLEKMKKSPYDFVMGSKPEMIKKQFSGFKHRFTIGNNISSLLINTKILIKEYGSLNECFVSGLTSRDATVVQAMTNFAAKFKGCESLIPNANLKSACKRLNLYLRWMVRKDNVDPGGWTGVEASKLIIPLDTHMFKIGHGLGFTKRNSADMQTAAEITAIFKGFEPKDPVKYDFALTRFGIREELDIEDFLKNAKPL